MLRRPLLLLIAAVTACLATSAASQSDDAALADFKKRRASEGERNRVLNDMEIGARSFWMGDLASARQSLDDAMLGINTVYANDPAAEKARSLWYEEGSKNFKGEPYERAMAFFYRSLLFLREGDYQNARAAARQGLLQDAFAEDDQSRADFALLMFIDAWASHLDGNADLREQALSELKRYRPNFPGIKPGDDTLVLVETGTAPRKLPDGVNHSYFVFRRGKGFTENRATLVSGATSLPLFPMEDIFYQASTRGGREIDGVLQGKAQFRNNANSASSLLLNSAVAYQDVAGGNTATYVVGGIGAMASFIGSRAKAQADTRAWSTLPDSIHVATFSSKDLSIQDAKIVFAQGEVPIAGLEKTVTIQKDPEGHFFIFARSR